VSDAPSPTPRSSKIPPSVPVARAAQATEPCSGNRSRPPESMVWPQSRSATINDIPELIRLRAVMFESMGIDASHPGWRREFTRFMQTSLQKDESVVALVVDDPSRPGLLAACGMGVVTQRLPNPSDPSGRVGYIASMVTLPQFRRRGCASAVLALLLGWFEARGVATIELHATAPSEPMYRAAGFDNPFGHALSRYGDDDPRARHRVAGVPHE
jgi:ribosomal protein S18 acetylase RimI-like enzyme